MITLDLFIVLLIGTIAMLVPILVQASWYKVKPWKCIIVALVLTITGTIGTRILYFIENLKRGGQSFFGAVFLVPIVFLLFAKIIRISYGRLMDLSAPAECVMLIIMKINCLMEGCCSGRELFVKKSGETIYFPSQIVELINALGIAIILLMLAKNKKNQGSIYAWYLVLYGCTRFVLNFFRAESSPVLFGMAYGSLWSLCGIVIGSMILICKKRGGSGMKENFNA